TLSIYLSLFVFLLFIFSFYCYRYHRALHSFPTRRSSDLSFSSCLISLNCGTSSCWLKSSVSVAWLLCTSFTTASRSVCGCTSSRSEEHTSELQSRFDLVCRLLLEKKKIDTFKKKSTTYKM